MENDMSKYIVCKVRSDGKLIAGTPPTVHADYEIARAEAERLVSQNTDAEAFLVFKAIARAERFIAPARTVMLD
jgi:hypothetical protein